MKLPSYQGGFSYLIALFAVAVVALLSLRALEHQKTKEQRIKEEELLFVGLAYQNAIRAYYEGSPGSAKQYPAELSDLLFDGRATKIKRPLRRLYRDPITGSENWGLIRNADGNLIGVYSLSTEKPIKVGGFPKELQSLTGANRYQDWKFVFLVK